MDSPFFSIVIPAYNRAKLVGRAIDSCLGQDLRDFEVVVVDDGSTDGTPEAVRRYADPRVRLVTHKVNRGVCPARNTGVDASRGEWIVFLDSDDELLPGALTVIHRRTDEMGPEIHRIVFMCRLDTGRGSVEPPLRDEYWDYEGYIRWAEGVKGPGDTLNIIRRTAFDTVRYPEGRSLETHFHLEFARNFSTRACSEEIGIVHSDANNRSLNITIDKLLAEAPDNAIALAGLLSRHGWALREWGPSMFFKCNQGAATFHFLAGLKLEGLRFAAHCLKLRPFSPKILAVTAFGVLGPRPLAWLKSKIS